MKTVLVTGGTGMIGTALTHQLAVKGYKIIILTRDRSKLPSSPLVSFAQWDVEHGQMDENAIKQADYIVHLAGEGIADKRWTNKRKKQIVDSRVNSARLIVKALKEIPNKVSAVISASAIGWYGPDLVIPNPRPFREEDPAHDSFLGNACREWESATADCVKLGKRVVWLRTGIVLSAKGGAFPEFLRPLKFGIATILGHGRQVISWIHIDDLVRLYVNAIEDQQMSGPFNAVAPSPVSNRDFVLEIARRKKAKWFVPVHVPSLLLKLALGEMSIEVLKSATVSCDKLHHLGYEFAFPRIADAIGDLVKD